MIPITVIAILVLYSALAWRHLKFALVLLAGLLPVYLIRFQIGPVPTTMLEPLILIAFAVWFFKKRAWKIDYKSFGPIVQPLLLLLAAASFAVVAADDTFSALGIWKAYFIEPAMVFIMMRSVFETRDDWMNVLKALAVSALVVSIFAFYQFVSGSGIPVPWDIERRVTSIFEFPNALGLFLAPIIATTITLFATKKKLSARLFWATAAVLGLFAIILAKTEAALVAIPAALLGTYLVSAAPRRKKILASVFAILAMVIVMLASPVARQKILLQDYSGQVRLSQWSETGDLLKDHPVFGVGLNQYPAALEPYHDPALYEIFQYPHNIFLNTWVELGLLGLLAFFWLAWHTLKGIRAENNDALKLAAFAGLLAMAAHGLVDVPYFKNDLAVMTWIFFAVISLTPAKKKR